MRSLIVIAIMVCACGSKELPPSNLPPFPEQATEAPRPPPGTLWREDVDAVLQAGLGSFLQLVAVEPYFESGQFVGWEVVDLRPPELWSDIDLQPGDVVTGINGMPIERDREAFAAFESLAEAQQLRVAVLRQGRGHELTFRIEPMPSAEGGAAREKPQTSKRPQKESRSEPTKRASATGGNAK